MKRYGLLSAVMLTVVCAAPLSAELTIGGLLDMAIIPFQYITLKDASAGQEEAVWGAGLGRYGSGQGARARLDVRGSKDSVIGFRARIQARTDGIGIEDYLQAWWKPLDWLRVDAGRFLDDRLRGRISDDEKWNAYTVRMYDGDAIFTRFKTHWAGQAGWLVSLTPVENLYLGVMQWGLSPLTPSNSTISGAALFDSHPDMVAENGDAFWRMQAAAAWTFPGLGLARIQYFGNKPGVTVTAKSDQIPDGTSTITIPYYNTFAISGPRIEAAFAWTGMPGLTVDAGVKIPLPFTDWEKPDSDIFAVETTEFDPAYDPYRSGLTWQAPWQFSAGAEWITGKWTVAGRIDSKFLGSTTATNGFHMGPELNVHLWPSYDFGVAVVGLDAGFEYIGPSTDNDRVLIGDETPYAMNGGVRAGFGVSMWKQFGNGCLVKGGVALKPGTKVNSVQEKSVFTVPLYVEYSF